MNLDEELRRLFADDRLDIAVRPGAVDSVVAASGRTRRRRVALTAAGGALTVGILVAGGIALGSVDHRTLPPVAPTGTSTTSAPPTTTTTPGQAVTSSPAAGAPGTATGTAVSTTSGPTRTTPSTPALLPGEVRFGPNGFGKLRLGMSLAQALATGQVEDPGDEAPSDPATCGGYRLTRYPGPPNGFQVGITGDRGIELISAPGGARTAEG